MESWGFVINLPCYLLSSCLETVLTVPDLGREMQPKLFTETEKNFLKLLDQ